MRDKDYRSIIPREAPPFLDCGEDLERGALIYDCVWEYDDVYGDLLRYGRPKKKQMVRVRCAECGGEITCEKTPGERGVPYGFNLYNGIEYDRYLDGESTMCPFCGTESLVMMRRKSEERIICETYRTTATVPDIPERPLVLTGWCVRKLVRNGMTHIVKLPCEAYIFEAEKAYKLNGWRDSYGGYSGYYKLFTSRWSQPEAWSDSWGQDTLICGLTRELIESSALPNCKLYEYMYDETIGSERRYPIRYLRAIQKHPQLENIVVQHVAHLLHDDYDQSDERYQRDNRRGVYDTGTFDFTAVRPAAMLGLNRDEFARLRHEGWSLTLLRAYRACKNNGETLSRDDMELLVEFGDDNADVVIGIAPLGRIVRYLFAQIEEEAENEDTDPYAALAGENVIDYRYYADYIDMAKKADWDLSNKQVLFPRDLIEAHDRASATVKAIADKNCARKMRARVRELEPLAWENDGLIIRPAHSQRELIREGKLLSHCVAYYYEPMAKGETAIFFIRRAEHPNTPFYTLELDEQRLTVKQNRGKHNCSETDEVIAFKEAWLEHLKEEREKQNGKRNNERKLRAGA